MSKASPNGVKPFLGVEPPLWEITHKASPLILSLNSQATGWVEFVTTQIGRLRTFAHMDGIYGTMYPDPVLQYP